MEALSTLYFYKSEQSPPRIINADKDPDTQKEIFKNQMRYLSKREPIKLRYWQSMLMNWKWLCCNFCCLAKKSKSFQKRVQQVQGLDLAREYLNSEIDLKNIIEMLRLSKFLVKVNMNF